MPSIRLETMIAAPVGDCFDLSLSVDAHTASMRASGERAISGVTSGMMKLGDTVTWRARHFGITFRMTSAITECQYPGAVRRRAAARPVPAMVARAHLHGDGERRHADDMEPDAGRRAACAG